MVSCCSNLEGTLEHNFHCRVLGKVDKIFVLLLTCQRMSEMGESVLKVQKTPSVAAPSIEVAVVVLLIDAADVAVAVMLMVFL